MRSLKGEAGSALNDVIFWASQDLERRQGRKVIILVADGGDTT